MKKLSIFLLALIFGAGTIFADGIKVGDIWYNFTTSNLTAEVTYQGDDATQVREYSGPIDIPSSVIYNTNKYTVTSIGEGAFQDCIDVTSVTIPSSVTSIGHWAFCNCTSLTSITIPNSVTIINDNAFMSSGLTSVSISRYVTSIGEDAFNQCSALTAINVDAENPNYCSENGVLFNKAKTTLFCYPMGKSGTDYAVPNGVEIIRPYAFQNCTALTSVTIPASVTQINGYAFFNCTSLASVTNYATTPQGITDSEFQGVNKSTCKLFVPQSALNDYRAAANWSAFSSIGAIMTANEDDGTYYSTFFDSSFKYILPAGVEAYAAIAVSEDVLNLTKVAEAGDVIPGGKGFILVSSVENYQLETSTASPVSVSTNKLEGKDEATTDIPSNCYVLSGGSDGVGFYRFSGSTLGAHKAYLTIAPKAGAPRRLRFSFSETNATTAVDQVQGNKVQGTKILENGQLYIMYNGVKYNVQGQVVK